MKVDKWVCCNIKTSSLSLVFPLPHILDHPRAFHEIQTLQQPSHHRSTSLCKCGMSDVMVMTTHNITITSGPRSLDPCPTCHPRGFNRDSFLPISKLLLPPSARHQTRKEKQVFSTKQPLCLNSPIQPHSATMPCGAFIHSSTMSLYTTINTQHKQQEQDKIEHVTFCSSKKNHAFQHTSSLAKMFFFRSLCHLNAYSYPLSIITIHFAFIVSCIRTSHTGWEHGEIKSVSKVKSLIDHNLTKTTPNHHVLGIFGMLRA